MPSIMDVHRGALLAEACQSLGVTQEELGKLLGLSRRTIVRWQGSSGYPPWYAADVARAVHPRDPDLAARIAAREGSSLELMGIVTPRPPPPPPEPPAHMVDLVVCAAAEALDVSPRTVRPALAAAFRRARQAGLTLEQVERMLAPPQAPAAAPAKKRAKPAS
jgi:hypothetical protein